MATQRQRGLGAPAQRPIMYCHARRDTKSVGAGRWFYDPNQDAQCAYIERIGGGKWRLYIGFQVHDKPLSKDSFDFDSVAEAKAFVSEYFEKEIEDVTPSQLAALVRFE